MKMLWRWNINYEALMASIAEDLAKHPNITVVSTHLECFPEREKFYWVMIYK